MVEGAYKPRKNSELVRKPVTAENDTVSFPNQITAKLEHSVFCQKISWQRF